MAGRMAKRQLPTFSENNLVKEYREDSFVCLGFSKVAVEPTPVNGILFQITYCVW